LSYIPTKADEENLEKTLKYLREDWRGYKLIDVGSTAKGTWLRGHSDIDIYVICDAEADPDKSKEKSFFHASKILYPKGHEKKGQLTIWNFQLNGFDIDLVFVSKGWHKREDTTKHTDYFNEHLTDAWKFEVRKAKAYFKSKGVYGAEIGGIVGVAIEALIVLKSGFIDVCEWLSKERPFIQDPTMTEPRDLLASITNRRWRQLQQACTEYLKNPNFEYKVMSVNEFMMQYPDHCTLIFKRKLDRALDFQTLTSIVTKTYREMRNLEPAISLKFDTYVDSDKAIICYRIQPYELPPKRMVSIDPSIVKYKDCLAFKEAHPDSYEAMGKIHAMVDRKIRFPDTYFCNEVGRKMNEKRYERW